jgi:hypothetical protein
MRSFSPEQLVRAYVPAHLPLIKASPLFFIDPSYAHAAAHPFATLRAADPSARAGFWGCIIQAMTAQRSLPY